MDKRLVGLSLASRYGKANEKLSIFDKSTASCLGISELIPNHDNNMLCMTWACNFLNSVVSLADERPHHRQTGVLRQVSKAI